MQKSIISDGAENNTLRFNNGFVSTNISIYIMIMFVPMLLIISLALSRDFPEFPLAIGIVISLLPLLAFFLPPFWSIVTLSEEGVKITRFKKIVADVKWETIESIKFDSAVLFARFNSVEYKNGKSTIIIFMNRKRLEYFFPRVPESKEKEKAIKAVKGIIFYRNIRI